MSPKTRKQSNFETINKLIYRMSNNIILIRKKQRTSYKRLAMATSYNDEDRVFLNEDEKNLLREARWLQSQTKVLTLEKLRRIRRVKHRLRQLKRNLSARLRIKL